MEIRMTKATGKTPDGGTTAQRLREALAELASINPTEVPTASALCERVGVSRTALYRYHPDVVHELRELQQRRCPDQRPARREIQALRDEANALRLQLAQVAALVDHYFSAWQETSSLLQRRERELAELRQSAKPKVVPIRN